MQGVLNSISGLLINPNANDAMESNIAGLMAHDF